MELSNEESLAFSWTPKSGSVFQQDSQRYEGIAMWEGYLALLVKTIAESIPLSMS